MPSKKNTPKLAALVLAAGSSSRLGEMKQLVDYRGQSLLARACGLAIDSCEQVHCILGFQAERLLGELADKQVNILVNAHWRSGMSSSIAAGIRQVSEDIDAVLILLVDQWQLEASHIKRLIESWQKAPEKISLACKNAVGENNAAMGPPVIFPRRYFSELMELTGEQGARPLLRKHGRALNLMVLPQAFTDLDTPEQLRQLRAIDKGPDGKTD